MTHVVTYWQPVAGPPSQTVFDRRPELLPVFAQLCEPERQVWLG